MDNEWLPIETAPKKLLDWVLLGYYPDYMEGECQGGHPVVAYWNGTHWVRDDGRHLRMDGAFSPTHWMPFKPPAHSVPDSAIAQGVCCIEVGGDGFHDCIPCGKPATGFYRDMIKTHRGDIWFLIPYCEEHSLC